MSYLSRVFAFIFAVIVTIVSNLLKILRSEGGGLSCFYSLNVQQVL